RATMANPETGRIDADTLGALTAAYGHRDLGVYAEVMQSGPIACQDKVVVL
ncbi:MAG: molybdenum cofactor biosysynthesis protein, partial [Paracoccaceae bacterium]|nr:molybdenum cofactor biosysynthesis protein [Paracoccaceae bacterium]